MRRMLGFATVALAVGMAGHAGWAGERSGLYLAAGVGIDWLQDMGLRGVGAGPFESTINSGAGWAAIGALGYRVGNGIRGEVEAGYRQNEGKAFNGATV